MVQASALKEIKAIKVKKNKTKKELALIELTFWFSEKQSQINI